MDNKNSEIDNGIQAEDNKKGQPLESCHIYQCLHQMDIPQNLELLLTALLLRFTETALSSYLIVLSNSEIKGMTSKVMGSKLWALFLF